jgi:hypothetical protein
MSAVSQLELEHCKDLALLPGSLFEFTSRVVVTPRLHQLWALYALNRSISTIPSSGSDDSVKWAKLKWWSEEFVADPASPSRHPVLRALWQSDARLKIDNKLLLRLVNDAVLQVDATPGANEDVMSQSLANRGKTGILLELALDNVQVSERQLTSLATASELFCMLSTVMMPPVGRGLPLDLLARHQINTSQLDPENYSDDFVNVIAYLADRGIERFARALPSLNSTQAAIHMHLRWAMEARQLAGISRRTRTFLENGNRYGPADAWFAWRFCRRLQTGKPRSQ